MPQISRCGLTYPGKTVLVTGGSKGIGEGCARVFVDAGASVVICARGIEAGQALAAELTEKGPGACHFEPGDVSRPTDIQRVIERTVERVGRMDCLINNAGYHPGFKSIDDFTTEQFMDLIQTNLVSCFVGCKYALPHLRKTKGSIINMGSLVSVMGQEAGSIYCAAKGGINAFTKSLAIEESRYGVRVNVVLPGNILSYGRVEGVKNAKDPDALDALVDGWQPCNRSGTNEEVGQLCLFLASDAASYLTGIEIIISGGSELGYGKKYPLSFLKV